MTATLTLNKLHDVAGLQSQVWETSKLCMTKNASFLMCDSAYTIENITHTVGENGKGDGWAGYLTGSHCSCLPDRYCPLLKRDLAMILEDPRERTRCR